ncbi:MAG: DUF6010 family protein [Thermoanaerobaculales bacterium]
MRGVRRRRPKPRSKCTSSPNAWPVAHCALRRRGAARQLIALFLALIAGVYCGALLAQSVPGHFVALELAIAGAVFACAVVGLRASTPYLAAGYVLHGAWGLLHYPNAVPTRVSRWFPPMCAAFDFVVAVALLIGPWRPMA